MKTLEEEEYYVVRLEDHIFEQARQVSAQKMKTLTESIPNFESWFNERFEPQSWEKGEGHSQRSDGAIQSETDLHQGNSFTSENNSALIRKTESQEAKMGWEMNKFYSCKISGILNKFPLSRNIISRIFFEVMLKNRSIEIKKTPR